MGKFTKKDLEKMVTNQAKAKARDEVKSKLEKDLEKFLTSQVKNCALVTEMLSKELYTLHDRVLFTGYDYHGDETTYLDQVSNVMFKSDYIKSAKRELGSILAELEKAEKVAGDQLGTINLINNMVFDDNQDEKEGAA